MKDGSDLEQLFSTCTKMKVCCSQPVFKDDYARDV